MSCPWTIPWPVSVTRQSLGHTVFFCVLVRDFLWHLRRALDTGVFKNPYSLESARNSKTETKALWPLLPPISLDKSSISGKGSLSYLGTHSAESAVEAVWQHNSIPPLTQHRGLKDPHLSDSEPCQWCLSPLPLQVASCLLSSTA